MTLSAHRTGLAFGSFFAAFHLGWAALVATGVAQRVLDWVFWVHFLSAPFETESFDAGRAALLVAFAAAVGYASGFVFAWTWNLPRFQARMGPARHAVHNGRKHGARETTHV